MRSGLRVALRRLFAVVVGDTFRSHRIPLGPIAGSYIYMRPSISPRMYLGMDERSLARAAERLIRPGDAVYDVGAHIGYTAILFGKLVGPGGTVDAFELVPRTADILRRSLALNDLVQCRVHVVGLGDAAQSISVAQGPTLMGSLYEPSAGLGEPKGEQCEVVRLDDYFDVAGLPPPRLIKIDIEFAELAALRGARRVLSDWSPLLLIEFHSLELLQAGVDWLSELGYTTELLDATVLTAQSIQPLESFHETVLCYREACGWHQERLNRDWRRAS